MTNSPVPPSTQLDWVAPPHDLADLVHTFFVMETGEGRTEDIMPAYSAQIFAFVSGRATMQFPDREPGISGDVTVNAPMMRAAPMVLEGPMVNVGASFTPMGWAAFSGMPADKVHDCAIEVSSFVDAAALAPVSAALSQARDGDIAFKDVIMPLGQMIREVCKAAKREPRREHAKVVRAVEAWLSSAFNPPVGALYDSIDLGQRQVQRLCKRYYGVPPAQLLKRYRAIRAAMLLAHDDLPSELRDEVLGAYFDQAHLIHDIRRYTGRTPKRLAKDSLAQDLLNPDGHGSSGKSLKE